MGTNSLPAPAPRRRSFSLPSFRRSSAAERPDVLKNAEDQLSNSVQEAARVQKEAAWQWYMRGTGEAVLLPRPARPPVRNPQALISDDKRRCASGPRSSTAYVRKSSMPQEKLVNPVPLAESHRDVSRFKLAEPRNLSFAASGAAPPAVPTLPAAPNGGPSTPLYDEVEVSSLHTHMADFVQRLQHQGNPYHEHSSPARPPPPSVPVDQHQTKAPPVVAVASAGDHQQLTTLPCSPAPVINSKVPFHIKPFSSLQKLLRKVLSGSVPKCTFKSFPQIIDGASAAVYEPAEVRFNDVDSTNEYHHHHSIHHHHHHYHFSKSPDEHAYTILSRRRHSESGSSRPCSPTTLVEAGSDEEEDEDEVEERRIAAYLERRRRRRHSNSFSTYQLPPENAGFDDKDKGEPAHVESPMQIPARRYKSERFLAGRVPTMANKEDEFDEGTFTGIRSRRRHSAELHREQPSLEQTGGKREGGAYVLGGAGAGSRTCASAVSVVRRRHSESSKERPEEGAKQTPSLGRPYWMSPSAHYYVDVQERHIGVPTAPNAATTAGLNAALPPLYPQ